MQKLNQSMEVTIDASNLETFNRSYVLLTPRASVTVVIPTYERLEDLCVLLASIMLQTIKPLEIIVVDDTPSDSIKNKCQECKNWFKEEGINFVYLRNTGLQSLTVSRNLGVKQAHGELVTFLDSDVILDPEYFEGILKAFKEKPEASGIQGLIENMPSRNSLSQFLNRIFRLNRLTANDSCGFLEYPTTLKKTISCQNLVGSNMTYRSEIFSEFSFDQTLEKYSYMEDTLFSHSIHRKHPNQLFITPHARCIHKVSKAGRLDDKELKQLKNKHRKYVLESLFGKKGVFLYYWQTLGLKIKLTGKYCSQSLGARTNLIGNLNTATKDQPSNEYHGLVDCDYGYMEDEILPR